MDRDGNQEILSRFYINFHVVKVVVCIQLIHNNTDSQNLNSIEKIYNENIPK